jgi:two-component system LytT family response regulator
MLRVLIVDDEELGAERLAELLRESGSARRITVAHNYQEALKAVREEHFDVAFLDIEMPGMNGLELSTRLMSKNPKLFVVFQTAHEEYAKEAFDAGGVGYLVKPVSAQDVDKVLTRVSAYRKSTPEEVRLMGKHEGRYLLLRPDDLYYVKAELTEAILRSHDANSRIRRKIYELEELLAPHGFFRVHRSYLVNLNKVRDMKVVEQSKFQIHFNDIDDVITSSKDGAKMLREHLETKASKHA